MEIIATANQRDGRKLVIECINKKGIYGRHLEEESCSRWETNGKWNPKLKESCADIILESIRYINKQLKLELDY